MDGKDAIIQKILNDATAQAEAMTAEANAYAKRIIDETAVSNKAAVVTAQKQAEVNGTEYIARRMIVCELDIKKQKLAVKKDMLDKVFDQAAIKIRSIKPELYKKVITGMLDESAADGDIITVAKADAKLIDESFIKDFAKNKGIKLTLDKELGNFLGGFILHSEGVDKNLSFEVEIKALREEYESEIAQLIFDEVK